MLLINEKTKHLYDKLQRRLFDLRLKSPMRFREWICYFYETK